jgi:hypothetical protein
MNYYVRVGQENKGPFSVAELRARGIDPQDYVWRDGLADWQPAGQLPELALLFIGKSASPSQPAVYAGDPASPYAPPKSSHYGDDAAPRRPAGPLRQSGFGIASSVIGLGTFVAVIAGFMIVGLAQQAGNINPNEPGPLLMVVSLSICFGGPLMHVIGLILGVVGIFQHDRSKLFGVMGTVINGLVIFGGLALFVIGFLIAAAANS